MHQVGALRRMNAVTAVIRDLCSLFNSARTALITVISDHLLKRPLQTMALTVPTKHVHLKGLLQRHTSQESLRLFAFYVVSVNERVFVGGKYEQLTQQ